MKKTLLATTAIVGVAFLAQSALAEGLTVSGGVKFKWSLSKLLSETRAGNTVVDSDAKDKETQDATALDIDTNFGIDSYELAFKASKDLANGMSAGMVADFDLGDSTRDNYYGYLSGGFGELQFGNVASAADSLVVGADYDSGEASTVSVDTSATGETAGEVGINGDSGTDDIKLAYYSPVFSGVKAGLSYALSTATGSYGRANGHKLGLGVNYASDFGSGGSLELGVGFAASITPEESEEDSSTTVSKTDMGVQIGALYSISGATISAAFSMDIPGALQTEADKAAKAGVPTGLELTSSNPLAVAASINYNFGAGDVSLGGRYGLHGKASVIVGGLGVGYSFIDGFATNLDVAYSLASNGLADANENSKSSIGVALSAGVSF